MSRRTTDKLVNLRLSSHTGLITEKKKVCNTCGKLRFIIHFCVVGNRADNRSQTCKTCKNIINKTRVQAKRKENNWLKQFSPI